MKTPPSLKLAFRTALIFTLCLEVLPASASEPVASTVLDPALPAGGHDLVDAMKIIPGVVVDTPYATDANFLKRKLYPENKCYLRRSVAERLANVQRDLQKERFGLKLWDGYRPRSIQKEMWRILPDRRYVANPDVGSKHNRGASVDVTLVDSSGNEVRMPTRFDDFSPAAHVSAIITDKEILANRERLQAVMKRHGFLPLATEWWHFDAPEWSTYSLADISFEALAKGEQPAAEMAGIEITGIVPPLPSVRELSMRVQKLETLVDELRSQIQKLTASPPAAPLQPR